MDDHVVPLAGEVVGRAVGTFESIVQNRLDLVDDRLQVVIGGDCVVHRQDEVFKYAFTRTLNSQGDDIDGNPLAARSLRLVM